VSFETWQTFGRNAICLDGAIAAENGRDQTTVRLSEGARGTAREIEIKKMNYLLLAKDDPEPSVNCVSCGAKIGDSASGTSETICLICHARLLNDHFQEVRGGKSSNESTELPPRS
jgi:hypothetical protein